MDRLSNPWPLSWRSLRGRVQVPWPAAGLLFCRGSVLYSAGRRVPDSPGPWVSAALFGYSSEACARRVEVQRVESVPENV